jgi:hypothetical protein
MTPKVLAALNGSIKKWEDLVVSGDHGGDPSDCPLCGLFNNAPDTTPEDCIGCPVFEHTGKKYCAGTPCARHVTDRADSSETIRRRSALREVLFLRSLLP